MTKIINVIVQGSVELLLYLPILLVVSVYILPDQGRWIWLATLPFCYAAGFVLNRCIPSKRVYQLLIVAALISFAQTYMLYGLSSAFYVMPLGGLIVYRGARLVMKSWKSNFSVGYYAVAMLIYCFLSLILRIVPSFQPYMPILLWAGLLSLAITLLSINQDCIKKESLSGPKEPVLSASVAWQNRLIIMILYGTIVMVSILQNLLKWLVWLMNRVAEWIGYVINWALSSAISKNGGTPLWIAINPPKGELPLWLKWLENIAILIICMAIAVSFAAILYWLLKKLTDLLKNLFAKLLSALKSGTKQQARFGYVDDTERLVNWKQLRGILTKRLKKWISLRSKKEAWENLKNNRERIRYLYTKLVKQSIKEGYIFKSHLTPKETGVDIEQWDQSRHRKTENLVTLYEKARYGEKPVSDLELEAVRKEMEER